MTSSEAKSILTADDPGPCPKRPRRPQRPREMTLREEHIWSSEDGDCTLADLLHQIPDGVTADQIKVTVLKSPSGNVHTTLSYVHDVPNTRFQEQMRRYEEKLKRYDDEIATWAQTEEEWSFRKRSFDESIDRVSLSIRRIIEETTSVFKGSL